MLERAARLVGPLRGATERIVEPVRETYEGELEVDETIENLLGKDFPEREDWIVERSEERRTQLVCMVDASLSMAGPKQALAAAAVAVLALKVHGEDLSIVVFENGAKAISHLNRENTPEEVVRGVLEQPCRGLTNIEDALRVGAHELARGRNPRKAGLLITDGVYTRGGDPTPLAAAFPHLFVMLVQDGIMLVNERLCFRLADRGRGDVFHVRDPADLPRRMVDVAQHVLR